ncbi:hypothetical protein B0H12DRAFT_1098820, partial [Mycena haematopus]
MSSDSSDTNQKPPLDLEALKPDEGTHHTTEVSDAPIDDKDKLEAADEVIEDTDTAPVVVDPTKAESTSKPRNCTRSSRRKPPS